MEFQRVFDMTISREEFFRLLPGVVASFDADGESVRWSDAGRQWLIRLTSLDDRRMGAVTVARHRVQIILTSCSESEGDGFVERFHRTFLRGGG